MLKLIPFEKLINKGNVRNERDETINELVESIEKNGLLQPLAVRPSEGGKYEIVAGHRRYEALRRIGEQFVECNILDDVADKEVMLLQIAENVQRNQMSAYELVLCFDELKQKRGYTIKQIAKILNKPESWVRYQYTAVHELNALYGSDKVPAEAKKLSAGQVQFKARKKKQGNLNSYIGNGFSCKNRGHSFQLYFSSFQVEQNFVEWLKENGVIIYCDKWELAE